MANNNDSHKQTLNNNNRYCFTCLAKRTFDTTSQKYHFIQNYCKNSLNITIFVEPLNNVHVLKPHALQIIFCYYRMFQF